MRQCLSELEQALNAIKKRGEKFTRFQKYIVVSSLGRMWRFKKNPLGNRQPHLRPLVGALAGQQQLYRQIRDDDGKLRYRHDIVWMAFNNADEVPVGFQIHHINGNVGDDRLSNLQCMPFKEHQALHAQMRRCDR